jgi:preprotein translocase subunit SecE
MMSKSDAREIKEKDDKRKSRNMIARDGHDKKSENRLYGIIKISSNFLRDCKMELKRVKWPTRKELLATTAMVIFLVIIVAFILGVADALLVEIIEKIAG